MNVSLAQNETNDWRPPVIGGASILIAVSAAVAGWLGVLPSTVGTALVIAGSALTLRIAWAYTAKSSAANASMATLISNVGLGISALTLLAALPRITTAGGFPFMFVDVASQLWTLAILTLAAGAVRTFGWRVYAGTFLTGFLALTGLARFIGRPLIERFGTSDVLAVGLWVPITEEAIKLIPVTIVLFVALRRTNRRPSAMDITLLGAWSGAGFAIYESATAGRGTFSLVTEPVLSWLYPMATRPIALGWPVVQVGHLIHSALLALGFGVFFLYRKRVRLAPAILAASVVSVVFEHCAQNAISTGNVNELVARIMLVLDAGGRLASIVLLAGVACVAFFETRALGRPELISIVRLTKAEASRRSALLAKVQTGSKA